MARASIVFSNAPELYSMDLSWNYAAESQAYDRVHRLGQEKDVFVKRLVVENTIEERMLRLQDVKMGTLYSIVFMRNYMDLCASFRPGRCCTR
jgi:SNF2 family DNA or RNA helicase